MAPPPLLPCSPQIKPDPSMWHNYGCAHLSFVCEIQMHAPSISVCLLCQLLSYTDSPMTRVVIWLLLVPCLFLTSQMKVVLTASSTFFTISLLSFTVTASGSEPDALDREWKNIFKWLKKNKNKDTKSAELARLAHTGEGLANFPLNFVRKPKLSISRWERQAICKERRPYAVQVTVVGAGLALARHRSMASVRPTYQLLS